MNSRRVMLAPLMTEHRTGKNYRAGRGNVRFGSLADITATASKPLGALFRQSCKAQALGELRPNALVLHSHPRS